MRKGVSVDLLVGPSFCDAARQAQNLRSAWSRSHLDSALSLRETQNDVTWNKSTAPVSFHVLPCAIPITWSFRRS